MMEENRPPNDDLRPCPTCRMPISVLATRCRFCGEVVGRPRREQEKLTVEDLGGTQRSNYTISSDVMDALESFRAEVLAEQDAYRRDKEAAQGTWFGHRPQKSEESTGKSDSGLPELDAEHRDLAMVADDVAPKSAPRPLRRPSSSPWPRRFIVGGGLLAAAVIFFVLFGKYGDRLTALFAGSDEPEKIVYENKAMAMIQAGRPSLEALEEAMEALKYDNGPANKEIAAKVRTRFIAEIKQMISAEPFAASRLDEASRQVNRAALIDGDSAMQELLAYVNDELASYRVILVSVDKESGKATFKIHNANFPAKEQIVSVGDYVQDRFLVKLITPNMVKLEDTKIRGAGGNRRLAARMLTQVEAD